MPSKPKHRPIQASEFIEVRRSPRHGLGVFARSAIGKGDEIERCPVLLVEPDDADAMMTGSLSGYVYDWGDGYAALALGYGSLYNHEFEPKAEYGWSDDGLELIVTARTDIAPGEEITIDYTGGGQIELWFEPKKRPRRR